MKEYLEIRVPAEDFAPYFVGDKARLLGRPPGLVWAVMIPTNGPRFEELGRQRRQSLEERGKPLFYGWLYHRKYTQAELRAAELFYLHINAAFEPTGDECGTQYDVSTACPGCWAGPTQISDLYLNMRRIPKSKDIARTIYNEYIVSQRLAQILVDNGITGFELGPVHHRRRTYDDPIDLRKLKTGRRLIALGKAAGIKPLTLEFELWLNRPEQAPLMLEAEQEHLRSLAEPERVGRWKPPIWYQLKIIGAPMRMAPPTVCGVGPFDVDEEGKYRCRCGRVAGLNPLSQLYVTRSDWDGSDFAVTKEYVGRNNGIRQLILISPRLFRLLRDNKIRGWQFEVAYLV